MSTEATLGITPASGYTSQLGLVYNSVFPSVSKASFIGGLSEDNTDINVLSQLDANVSQDFYKFNFESGSALKLAFNTTSALNSSDPSSAGTSSDAVAANLRFQLYDVTGRLVADSGGTPDQQTAYNDLTSSSGFATANGSYYVKISAAPTTSITKPTSYNFQLYSGTTYSTSLTYTAQTQSYDPNLFKSASDTITPNSNITTYTNSANLTGTQASALNIGTLDVNKSELYANSQVNSTNKAAYYSFDFNSGTALKFNLYNTTSPTVAQTLRVQLFDSKGKVVADSQGTDAQKEAYKQFDSGAGLHAATGKYSVKISYAPGSFTSSPQTYNFQIYSGSTYDTLYKTTATIPTPNTNFSKIGQDVGVFADKNAKLFTRQEYHKIGEDALGAPNIGWLSENKSALNVVSRLTPDDNTDFYHFTLQKGKNLKFAFENQTNTAKARIQLLDETGKRVFADNYGTAAQKKAFADLTSSTGFATNPQIYSIKVTYAPGEPKTQKQTYNFQVYSGTSYTSLYKVTAAAQTRQNAVLSGNPNVVGFSAASYLTNAFTSSITDSLSPLYSAR